MMMGLVRNQRWLARRNSPFGVVQPFETVQEVDSHIDEVDFEVVLIPRPDVQELQMFLNSRTWNYEEKFRTNERENLVWHEMRRKMHDCRLSS